MTVEGLPVYGNNTSKHFIRACDPTYEEALERIHIHTRKQDSQLIMARCSVLKRQETTQKFKFHLVTTQVPWPRSTGEYFFKAYAFCSAGTIFLQNVVASNT